MARPFKKLRDELRICEITQEELATELHIGLDTVSRKMNAHCPWTLDQMYAILELLGIDASQMHIYFPKNGQNEPGAVRARRRTA